MEKNILKLSLTKQFPTLIKIIDLVSVLRVILVQKYSRMTGEKKQPMSTN